MTSAPPDRIVMFRLSDRRFGLPLGSVEHVLRAAAITPLPGAPPVVSGVIDVHGDVVPVVDVRARFGLPQRELEPGDHLVLARTATRPLAVCVDEVLGVLDGDERNRVAVADLAGGAGSIDAVVKLPDGLVLIHDIDRFLSLEEDRSLARALDARGGGRGG